MFPLVPTFYQKSMNGNIIYTSMRQYYLQAPHAVAQKHNFHIDIDIKQQIGRKTY